MSVNIKNDIRLVGSSGNVGVRLRTRSVRLIARVNSVVECGLMVTHRLTDLTTPPLRFRVVEAQIRIRVNFVAHFVLLSDRKKQRSNASSLCTQNVYFFIQFWSRINVFGYKTMWLYKISRKYTKWKYWSIWGFNLFNIVLSSKLALINLLIVEIHPISFTPPKNIPLVK